MPARGNFFLFHHNSLVDILFNVDHEPVRADDPPVVRAMGQDDHHGHVRFPGHQTIINPDVLTLSDPIWVGDLGTEPKNRLWIPLSAPWDRMITTAMSGSLVIRRSFSNNPDVYFKQMEKLYF
jgi:hypothetical protein